MEQAVFIKIIEELIDRDRTLTKIVENWGYPPQWQRKPGFATLIHIILEQQVSGSSAKATFERLNNVVKVLTPASFLALDDLELKQIGFSRQKTIYGRQLAQTIIDGVLNLEELANLEDSTIRKKLIAIKGIGDWTVDMYLMMALQRLDIFPSKDLAVAIAVWEIKNLPTRPTISELELIAQPWKPYRSIATQLLWHYYLHRLRS